MIIVIEKGGFCRTKKKVDLLETDTIVCEVKDTEHGEAIIHGRNKEEYETKEV